MRRLVYRSAARDDLLAIFEFIAREAASTDQGRRVVDALRRKCARLAQLPGELGRPRPELRPDIRSFPFKGYVIFFRYRGDVLEVVNILHGNRDVDAYFGS
ncbi:type II toxin-antitoxin system RelE/ParE family toxin [Zavarzinia compransoris]|uniref:Type II toxin-antitoxin system RelE/ParE family toxin n=1 Tax=Zavarzinia compransoris TaxID=1264899 RepID=A0A317DZE0_9PROT|nr:type II toxin-antitoxin system RelE/ParE family toxin [Zavarzinia compransoris]PWR20079.1 type II toxin-antitoxin system RelE/ParE family toxin [Zavarzinia compransoris]